METLQLSRLVEEQNQEIVRLKLRIFKLERLLGLTNEEELPDVYLQAPQHINVKNQDDHTVDCTAKSVVEQQTNNRDFSKDESFIGGQKLLHDSSQTRRLVEERDFPSSDDDYQALISFQEQSPTLDSQLENLMLRDLPAEGPSSTRARARRDRRLHTLTVGALRPPPPPRGRLRRAPYEESMASNQSMKSAGITNQRSDERKAKVGPTTVQDNPHDGSESGRGGALLPSQWQRVGGEGGGGEAAAAAGGGQRTTPSRLGATAPQQGCGQEVPSDDIWADDASSSVESGGGGARRWHTLLPPGTAADDKIGHVRPGASRVKKGLYSQQNNTPGIGEICIWLVRRVCEILGLKKPKDILPMVTNYSVLLEEQRQYDKFVRSICKQACQATHEFSMLWPAELEESLELKRYTIFGWPDEKNAHDSIRLGLPGSNISLVSHQNFSSWFETLLRDHGILLKLQSATLTSAHGLAAACLRLTGARRVADVPRRCQELGTEIQQFQELCGVLKQYFGLDPKAKFSEVKYLILQYLQSTTGVCLKEKKRQETPR